jgi:hypothetical protein
LIISTRLQLSVALIGFALACCAFVFLLLEIGESEGTGILVALGVPVILAALAIAAMVSPSDYMRRFAWLLEAMLLAFSIVMMFSTGLFFFLSAFLILNATVLPWVSQSSREA